jgi:hypothetical protein
VLFRSLYQEYKAVEKQMGQIKNATFDAQKVLNNLNGATPKELKKALKELNRELEDIPIGSDKAVAKIKEIETVTNKLHKEVKAAGGGEGGEGIIGEMFGKFTIAGLAISAIEKVGESAKDLYKGMTEYSATAGDKYKEMITGADFASKSFFKTIADGDFSNLIDNMVEAYKIGQEYAETMNLIEKRTIAVNAVHLEESATLSQLEETLKDVTKTDEERLEAGKKWAELHKTYYGNNIDLANQELNANLKAIGVKKDEFKQYLDFDAAIPGLRKHAEEYNTILSHVNNLQKNFNDAQKGSNIVTSKGTVINQNLTEMSSELEKAKEELNGFSNAAVNYAKVLRDVEGSNVDERVKATVEAYNKANSATDDFYQDNKRVMGVINSEQEKILQKQREDAIKWQKEQEKLAKAEAEIHNKLATETLETYSKLYESLDKIRKENSKTFQLADVSDSNNKLEILQKQEEADIEYKKSEQQRLLDSFNQGKIGRQQYNDELAKIDQKAADERNKNLENEIKGIVDIAKTSLSSYSKIISEVNKADDTKLNHLKDNNDKEKENIQRLYDQGVISKEEYDKRISKADKKLDNETKKLQAEKAKRESQLALFEQSVATAVAIANAIKLSWTSSKNYVEAIIASIAAVGEVVALMIQASNYQKTAPEFAGGNLSVIGENTGKKYNANYNPNAKTGYYSRATYTGHSLFAEREPEIYVDGPTTRNIMMNYPAIYNAIQSVRVPQFASGSYPTNAGISNSRPQTMSDPVVVSLLSELLSESKKAKKNYVLFDDIEKTQNTVNTIRNSVT